MKPLAPLDLASVHPKQRIIYDVTHLDRGVPRIHALDEPRFNVVEVNAVEGLLNMELARLSIETDAIPIEDPVSGVRILLDFKQHNARADGMHPPAWQKHHV